MGIQIEESVAKISRRELIWVLALFTSALGIRLLALWMYPDFPLSTNATYAYLSGAQLLLEGKGFSDPSFSVLTPPFYAVIIAACSLISENAQLAVKVFQVIIDSATVVLIYLIVREVFSLAIAQFSSVVWAVYPFAIYTTLYIGPEAHFTFFLCSFVLLFIQAVKFNSYLCYCASGIVLGLATLTRGTTQFLPIPLGFLLIFLAKNQNEIRKAGLIFLLSFVVTLLPWTLRNYIVLQEFIPVATSGGMVFLYGSSSDFYTIESRERTLPEYLDNLSKTGFLTPKPGGGPKEKANFLFEAGLQNYRNKLLRSPGDMPFFLTAKFFRMWYSTESGNSHGLILGVNLIFYLFAIWGIYVIYARPSMFIWLPLLLIAYFIIVHWLALPLFRYMVPIMPYVIAIAGLGIEDIGKRLKWLPLITYKNR
ncbi:glycosyltransferase family 39 protein [Nitrospira sp. KM1]|uniref:glycosyltransferase family 39 protein n=1 Tax=Nitrospira sp. KM1 TaxID=1936990 RepID=UPI0015675C34|nr:glycosyltransferase family 39 protein [Nitrospira sp. KM1]